MPNEEQPRSGTRLSAMEIHDNIREPAEQELERPATSLCWSSFQSGMAIGFSFLAAAFASQLVAEEHRRAAAAAAYPLGFIFVIMARSELFTENTVDPVVPFLERRDRETFRKLLRMWGLLLAGNLVGALIFGWVLARTSMVEPHLHVPLARLASEAVAGGFVHVLYAAVFAGWLVALLTWLLASTRSTGAQIAMIWLCTAPIHAFGFRHSIAGSIEAFYLASAGRAEWGTMLFQFVVPAVVGNAIGGVLLVALLNYGQVAAERGERARQGRRARRERQEGQESSSVTR